MTAIEPEVPLTGRYSMTEAAAILGISRQTLYNWCEQGLIQYCERRVNKRRIILGREIIRCFKALAS
jgi:excisionase family DNA binding protein